MIAALQVSNLAIQYGGKPVLDHVSFTLDAGSIGCLLGPSGCGKTTALRIIAGFETPDQGSITLNGKLVSQPNYILPPEKRRIGMVFQDYSLFPHLRVDENVGFGLSHLSRSERTERVVEMLDTVGLSERARAYPHELSGGQQQRVALARALAPRPALLLLDEPFSNLDIDLREKLATEVRDLLKHEGATALMVTHDQHEAFAMADVIGIMHEGHIQQWDSAYNIYHSPINRFVADFVGMGVFLPGRVLNEKQVEIELGVLEGIITTRYDSDNVENSRRGYPVSVLLRPDDVIHDDDSPMQAEIEKKVFRGADFLYTLKLASGARILSLVHSHHDHAVGERIGITLAADHVIVYPEGK